MAICKSGNLQDPMDYLFCGLISTERYFKNDSMNQKSTKAFSMRQQQKLNANKIVTIVKITSFDLDTNT